MEVRLTLDDDLIAEMMRKTGATRATDLTRDALTMLHWAIGEAAEGRLILSADDKGQNPQRLAMPMLTQASRRQQSRSR